MHWLSLITSAITRFPASNSFPPARHASSTRQEPIPDAAGGPQGKQRLSRCDAVIAFLPSPTFVPIIHLMQRAIRTGTALLGLHAVQHRPSQLPDTFSQWGGGMASRSAATTSGEIPSRVLRTSVDLELQSVTPLYLDKEPQTSLGSKRSAAVQAISDCNIGSHHRWQLPSDERGKLLRGNSPKSHLHLCGRCH